MIITDQTTACDLCHREGTFQEVGRGSILIQGTDDKTQILFGEVCERCAQKAIVKLEEIKK